MAGLAGISLTRKTLHRAYWAADERHDWQEANRLGALLNDLDGIELETPLVSLTDAAAKLRRAAAFLLNGGGALSLVKRVNRIACAIEREGGPSLRRLIELRACAAAASRAELDHGILAQVAPRISAALAWLARPCPVAPVAAEAERAAPVPEMPGA
jgi:hypothetical protein